MVRASMSARLTALMPAAGAVFLINACGSFVIGAALGVVLTSVQGINSGAALPLWFQIFAIGILGGFTTVSTGALQIHELWQRAERRTAVAVALGSVILCPALAATGLITVLAIGGAL